MGLLTSQRTQPRALVVGFLTASLLAAQAPLPALSGHSPRVVDTPEAASQASLPAHTDLDAPPAKAAEAIPPERARIAANHARLPLSFEPNLGQTDKRALFVSRGPAHTLFLTSEGIVLGLRGMVARVESEGDSLVPSALRLDSIEAGVSVRLFGANPSVEASGVDALPGAVHYFIGNDPARWRTNVPTYAKVRYQNVYEGVDLFYYGSQGHLEFDFVVSPGADPRAIALHVDGAERLELRGGDVILRVSGGELVLRAPHVYQEVNGAKRFVTARYAVLANQRIGVEIGPYDPTAVLVIDPVIAYSTFLGGAGADFGLAIAVDSSGNVYVAGQTGSTNFPTTTGAFDTTANGSEDVFVTKINAAGSAVVWSTYLGGSGPDFGLGIAVDGAGNVYVTGRTDSTNFPTTVGAFDTTCGTDGTCNATPLPGGGTALLPDAFVTKLNAAGSALVYSTYIGGNHDDRGLAIAVDAAGNAHITGHTTSSNFPTTPGAFQTTFQGSTTDAFVTKLNASGTALVYSTYLGGSGPPPTETATAPGGLRDVGRGIAVGPDGSAYVTGSTDSTNFPTTTGAFQTAHASVVNNDPSGFFDGFITKFSPTGTVVYSTFLGGDRTDHLFAIAVGIDGTAYVAGATASFNYPAVNAFDATYNFGGDAVVTRLNSSGSALIYSTYLGGSPQTGNSGHDEARGIAADNSGNAYIVGLTDSTNFPTSSPIQATNGGGFDAFVARIDTRVSGAASLPFSSYLGTTGAEEGLGIALDSSANSYVTGWTTSAIFPTTGGAAQTASGGGVDGFVAKIAASLLFWTPRASMPTSRQLLGVAAATNGKIYAVGGHNAAGTVLATVEEYDPATNTWTTKASIPTARYGLGLVAGINGKLYAIGGSTAIPFNPIATVEEYDPFTNTWTAKASMPTARGHLRAVAANNGRIYAIGGLSSAGSLATVEEYDPETNTWGSKASMPTARHALGVAAAPNGRVYAIGGQVGAATRVNTNEEYDPFTNTWTAKASMPTVRNGLEAVASRNGKVYAMGGSTALGEVAIVEEYDPATNSWTTNAGMPTARSGLGAAAGMNGKIYALGGLGGMVANEEANVPGTARALTLNSGAGTATIDGVQGTGEWDSAATFNFTANLESGGTAPATLYVMNDGSNLYLAVKVNRTAPGSGSSVAFEFDNENDSPTAGSENGDDAIVNNPSLASLADDVRTNKSPPCPAGSAPAVCAPADTAVGGTNDGQAGFTNNGTFSFYEISHPLNSADDFNDFNLAPGSTVGFVLFITFCSPCVNTSVPGSMGEIVIAAAGDTTPPPAPALLSPADGAFTNNSTPTFDWADVTDPSGVTYELQVDNSGSTFPSPEINQTGLTASIFTPTTPLVDGAYSWRVRARDGAGNVGAFSAVRTFTVDRVPPPQPPQPSVLGLNSATQTWTGAAEPGSLVKLKINCATSPSVIGTATADPVTGAYTITTSPPSSGTYTDVCVTATDAAGNESLPSAGNIAVVGGTAGAGVRAGTVTADTTPPAVTVGLAPATGLAPAQSSSTSTQPINFLATFTEFVYGFASADASIATSVPCGTLLKTVTPLDPNTLAPLAPFETSTKFNIQVSGMTTSCTVTASAPAGVAEDAAHNTNTASTVATGSTNSVAYSFVADTTPPVVSLTGTPADPSSANVTFGFSSNEAGSTFQCRLDVGSTLGTFEACSSPKQYTNLSSGTTVGGQQHTFNVRATDAFNNVSSPASFSWTVAQDSDGDGLLDSWETAGFVDVVVGATTVRIDLPDADPNRKDIYLQIDWMQDSCHAHKPTYDAIKVVYEAFKQAPVSNPVGVGIKLHVDLGPDSPRDYDVYTLGMNYATYLGAKWGSLSRAGSLSHVTTVGTIDAAGRYLWARPAGTTDTLTYFEDLKQRTGGFAASAREAFYHYVVWGHQWDSGGSSGLSRSSGGSGGGDFMVTLGAFSPFVSCTTGGTTTSHGQGTRNDQAGTLMHELGHNLGLGHGGDEATNRKPNYLSVMSYAFQNTGLTKRDASGTFVSGVFDYSDSARAGLATLDERAGLSEPSGLGPSTAAQNYGTTWMCPFGATKSAAPASGALDWNCSNAIDASLIVASGATINGDGKLNSDVACVGPGPDGKLDTVPNAASPGQDDYRYGQTIRLSDNRTCNSAPAGDDVLLASSEERPLAGFDDWGNIRLKAARIGQPGFFAGAPPQTDPEDQDLRLETQKNLTTASIDIMPSNATNTIPGTSGATIQVAILTTTALDAATVLAASVQFGPAGAKATLSTLTDANSDGKPDLVLTFNVAETGLGGMTQACLTGNTPTKHFRGCDSVDTSALNHPPTANAGGPYTGVEGSAITFTGSGSDPDVGDSLTFSWIFGDGSAATTFGSSPTATHTYTVKGCYAATLTVRDSAGATATSTAAVVVGNVAPTVGAITAPIDPVAVGTAISASASFTAPCVKTHTATWSWGDGTTSPGTVTETNGSGSVTGIHSYAAAGVYTVTLTVTDKDGGTGQAQFQFVVVFDPAAGFVTGGGWIDSPPGAFTADPTRTGRATFGFVAKYEKGATVPTGQTEFQFKPGNLNFHSTSYQWLVVSGAKAQYKGSGTINGAPGYDFLLTVTDGQQPGGGGGDKFRIRITSAAGVVYDNVPGGPLDLEGANPQAIGAGSIVIH